MYVYTSNPQKNEDNRKCALSVRISQNDMKYLKQSAESHFRTLADELRFIIQDFAARNPIIDISAN